MIVVVAAIVVNIENNTNHALFRFTSKQFLEIEFRTFQGQLSVFTIFGHNVFQGALMILQRHSQSHIFRVHFSKLWIFLVNLMYHLGIAFVTRYTIQ